MPEKHMMQLARSKKGYHFYLYEQAKVIPEDQYLISDQVWHRQGTVYDVWVANRWIPIADIMTLHSQPAATPQEATDA